MNDSQIRELFKRFKEKNADPVTELHYVNTYTLLVAVVLSAQATDKGVNKATADLFPIVDTPQKMLDSGLDKLSQQIKTIGLYKTKAKNVMALSQILVDEYQGDVPSSREELERLPGVGRKTANVVLNVAFGMLTMAVDTHIFRVSNRTGLAVGKTPRAVEDELLRRIPDQYLKHAHHWLILHGRYVCKAQSPKCTTCDVSDLCDYAHPNPTS